jgi:hypothetical protein
MIFAAPIGAHRGRGSRRARAAAAQLSPGHRSPWNGCVAFITDGPTVRDILVHLGAPITPPTVAPARGPPLWQWPPAGQREIDPQAQPAPDYEFDQRVAW